jgi:hypothetical protein
MGTVTMLSPCVCKLASLLNLGRFVLRVMHDTPESPVPASLTCSCSYWQASIGVSRLPLCASTRWRIWQQASADAES